MNEPSVPHLSALAPDQALRVEQLCTRFEDACKTGPRPRIEDYLGDAAPPERDVLLQELLRLELAYRRQQHETHSPEEYYERFPQYAHLIRAVFGAVESGESDRAAATPASAGSGPDSASAETTAVPVRLGRYRITGVLGKGAFGVVYRGHDDDLRRDVAIKVPHRQRVAQPGDVEAYLAEARIVASLDHPHIVPVHDVGRTDDGCCFVVSKFIEGSDLARKLQEGRPAFPQAAELIATVAEALHHAHRRGLVHRDIKSGNILMDNHGKAFVADFGLALKEEDFGKESMVAGTPAYMSPEQAQGEGHRVDGRSDIFSLGVVFYELLTGQRPFRGRTREDLFEQIARIEPRPPRQMDDTIPRELERICLKSLAKRVSERYPTAMDLADDLRHWQMGSLSRAAMPVPVVSPPSVHVQVTVPASSTTPPPSAGLTPTVRVTIVPKGLRSFDANDADFFLELLPGPRDRNGLPESIRFWKARIEESDPAKTFPVGLVYGPSGCGKSSLIKAGLLPRLASNVIVVYTEATAQDTETCLLTGLRNQVAGVPGNRDLMETLGALRRRRDLLAGRKVLLVLDQFEQWLHAHRGQANSALVPALRQCDGERVQCLILVRDDFWLITSRFMGELEIELVQGQNMALVDLFDLRHARKVLAAFGQAFAALPEHSEAPNKEQRAFLDQVTQGLAQDGKIIPVRLALFAEMVKGKPWTPATLKAVGGMEGIGVRFLEETFAAATAPPQHRLHRHAAQAVLKALLPEIGTDIRGNMRARQDLLAASGYATRPKDFGALLRILDDELRLITPTDPEWVAGGGWRMAGEEDRDAQAMARLSVPATLHPPPATLYYQLTHDYLVPSLRAWLSRKQKETRRGRAELRLEERAASWNAKPEPRNLPAWWEWLAIGVLVPQRSWNDAQGKLMRTASRYHGLRGVALAGLLAVAVLTAFAVRDQYVREKKATYAASLVERLLDAETAQVPAIVAEMADYRSWIDPRLRQENAQAGADSRQELHTSMALLPADPGQVDYLYGRLLGSQPHEIPVIRQALFPYRQQLVGKLWAVVERPEAGKKSQRLRAAAALAAYDPQNPRWVSVRQPVAEDLVEVPALHLATWTEALRSVLDKLRPPLESIFRDRQRRETERSSATEILADVAAGQANALAELLLDADATQFATLFPKLEKHAGQGKNLLLSELDRQLRPNWNDPGLWPTWSTPDPEWLRRIVAADGLWDDHFAFCQTLPLDEFVIVAKGLRKAGYRPIRFRPYATEKQVRVAAIWTRDRQEWEMAQGMPAHELQKRNEDYRTQSFHPLDVTGYVENGTERYAALWVKAPAGTLWTEWAVGLDEKNLQTKSIALRTQGYWRTTTTWFPGTDGQLRYAAIWSRPVGREPPYESMDRVFLGPEPDYSGEKYLADVQLDVHVGPAARSRSAKAPLTEQLVEAEKKLQAKPNDPYARYQRMKVRFQLGENEQTLEDLAWLFRKWPQEASVYEHRAIVYARQGKANEAKADLAKLQELGTDGSRQAYVDAILAVYRDEGVEGTERLQTAIRTAGRPAVFLYDAARVYAVAAGISAAKDVARAQRYANQAVALLKESLAGDPSNYALLPTEADFEPIRNHPEFLALLQAGNAERNYAAIWHPLARLESTELHGQDPKEHLARCKDLAAQGYRPAAVSVTQIRASQPLVTASVWHRPVVPEAEKEQLAKRQVNAAVALLKLGWPEKVWALLHHQPDPRMRNYLIHRLGASGAKALAVLQRLGAEPEVTARRALVLSLGGFGETDFSPEERASAIEKLRDIYRTDPDAGLHGAARWILRQWKQDSWLKQMDEASAKDESKEPRLQRIRQGLANAQGVVQSRWYVNGQGQTMAVFAGPVVFLMGSPRREEERTGGVEGKLELLHKRRIGQSFAIATHEVTVEQFLRFRKNHRYGKEQAPTSDCPVIGVNWYDAAEYCNWLSAKEKLPTTEWCYEPNPEKHFAAGMRLAPDSWKRTGYRLPTEAEWEYACRAGSLTSRHYGETEELLEKYAWYSKNSLARRTLPVGSLMPNDWGLFDMLGNAAEWTQDPEGEYLDAWGKPTADQQRTITDSFPRILRGGAFNNVPWLVRSATRFNYVPTNRTNNVGFRLARTLP